MSPTTLASIADDLGSTYAELLAKYQPRVIHTDSNLVVVHQVIEELMTLAQPSDAQLQLLELLSTLAETYESQSHPTPTSTVAELLAHLIDAKGVEHAEVEASTEIDKNIIVDVLAGRRTLSAENMSRLSTYFCVDSSLFIEASR